jgi:hypothetical protein
MSSSNDLSFLDDKVFFSYVYTDKANQEIIDQIKEELVSVDFIVRDETEWDIRYITGIIMNPNVKVLVIHSINDMSIAEIALASFMCKTILCVTNSIKEYEKILEMVTDIQTGCNLTINNNSFIHWYNLRRL